MTKILTNCFYRLKANFYQAFYWPPPFYDLLKKYHISINFRTDFTDPEYRVFQNTPPSPIPCPSDRTIDPLTPLKLRGLWTEPWVKSIIVGWSRSCLKLIFQIQGRIQLCAQNTMVIFGPKMVFFLIFHIFGKFLLTQGSVIWVRKGGGRFWNTLYYRASRFN